MKNHSYALPPPRKDSFLEEMEYYDLTDSKFKVFNKCLMVVMTLMTTSGMTTGCGLGRSLYC